LHDNYVDNSALLYIWAEKQPLASRATAERSAAVARNIKPPCYSDYSTLQQNTHKMHYQHHANKQVLTKYSPTWSWTQLIYCKYNWY